MSRLAAARSMAPDFHRTGKPARTGFMTRYDPIVSEFATSEDEAAYDAWFRARVERAMACKGPGIPHDQAMARMRAIIEKYKTA